MEAFFKSVIGRSYTPDEKKEEKRRRREERRRRRRREEERRRGASPETEAEEEEEEEEEKKKEIAPYARIIAGAGLEAFHWEPVPKGVPRRANQTWTNRVQFGFVWRGQLVVLGDLREGYCMPFAPKETSRRRLDWSRCVDIGSHGIVDASGVILPFLKEEGSFIFSKIEELLKNFK